MSREGGSGRQGALRSSLESTNGADEGWHVEENDEADTHVPGLFPDPPAKWKADADDDCDDQKGGNNKLVVRLFETRVSCRRYWRYIILAGDFRPAATCGGAHEEKAYEGRCGFGEC